MRWSSAQPCRISNEEGNAKHRILGFEVIKEDKILWVKDSRALFAIRLLVSVNLLYAAIFLKFAGAPGSVALFTQMSQAVHGLVFSAGIPARVRSLRDSGGGSVLIPKTARLGAGLTVMWMAAVILSRIFVLGYGWFFVDALILMGLAVIYLLLTRRHSHWGEPESVGTTTAVQTHKNSRANSWNGSQKILIIVRSAQVHIADRATNETAGK